MASTGVRFCVLKTSRFSKLLYPFSTITGHQRIYRLTGHRTVMSDSYINQDVWNQRKKLDTDMNELSIQLDRDFYDVKKPVSSIELHKFVDHMADSDDVEIAQGYLYCHRHSIMAPHLRDSTRHNWIRGCLQHNREDIALLTLQQRLHYGIFLDGFTFSLLLDSYLKKKDYKGAYLVAVEMMNQEIVDETEPLVQLLSLYACHMYLSNGHATQDDDWNLGMTLADSSRGLTSLIGRSYHVLGYGMTGNLTRTLTILQSYESLPQESQPCMVQEAVDKLKTAVDSLAEKDAEKNADLASQIQETLERLQTSGKISTESLDSLIPSQLLNLIPEYEHLYTKDYATKVERWHQEHLDSIRKTEEAEQERQREEKLARLDELLLEVEGMDFVKAKIEKELKEKEEREKEESAKESVKAS